MKRENQIENIQSKNPCIYIVYPDPQDYYNTDNFGSSINDKSSDVVLEDILDRYSDAWKKLAEY